MNESTSGKIVHEVMDLVRGPMPAYDALIFGLQLLCWAKISPDDHMPDGLKIQSPQLADPNWVRDIWSELGQRPGIIGAAYSGGNFPTCLEPSRLSAAIVLCMRLAETGVLEIFDPTDSFPQVFGRDAMEYYLPPELADAMIALARIEPSASMYAPWDHSAQLAERATAQGARAYIETMHDPRLPALICLFATGDIEIAHSDPIREPSAVVAGKLRQFDACAAFPPLGLRYTSEVVGQDWYNRFRDRSSSGAVLAVRHIVAQTSGRAVIAVPFSLLFSPGGEKALREDLLNQGHVEAVISMPSGLLLNPTISFALLVLDMKERHNTIRFVNAESEGFRQPIPKARARARLKDIEGIVARANGAITDELVAEVQTKEVINADCILQVNRYVHPEWQRKIKAIINSNHKLLLGDLVTIIRPMTPSTSLDTFNALEVMTSDLPEMGYVPPPSKKVQIDKNNATKRRLFLRPFDVLLVFKGSVGRVGITPESLPGPGEGGWLAGQSAVVLRVIDPEQISPKTLAVYLRSEIGQKLLESISVQGATIPMIQLRELQRLPVIVPPRQVADEIANILDEQAKIQHEIDQLRAQQVKLAHQVWSLE